jgi:membrane associated rhomboid family serine protease
MVDEQLWFIPSEASFLTVFTSLFVHADIFHLLGNMIYLFLFGATTEDILGRGKFLLLYLAGGVAAVLGHVALTTGHFASDLPLGGASGAISTCMGAFLLLLPKTSIEFKLFGLFFFRPFSRDFTLSAWIVMSFWFLCDLFWAVLEVAGVSESDGTAFGAHVGGFLLGWRQWEWERSVNAARSRNIRPYCDPEPPVRHACHSANSGTSFFDLSER